MAVNRIRRKAVSVGGGSGGNEVVGASTSYAQSVAQSPLYYDYRYSTPDKFFFPRNRTVANSIFRQVYMRDAAVGIGTDLYAELPWSQFDLVGLEDKYIKNFYEDMFNELDLVPKFTEYTKDYLITGELVLHTLFNSAKGYWERVVSHNPDYIRIEGVGLVAEQPLMWLRPTPELKRLVNNPDVRVRRLVESLPRELIAAARGDRDIPLDPLNTTYLARKNSSTDIRGTSMYTRLYRIIMYEDFVVNASLAVAQRNAAPLRIFKLGDPETGWLPDEEDEAAFAEMLSVAESDPLAAIIMHHNISVELVGVSDRVLLISREWDFIERVKLLAMGISKSFLTGESSFASAVAGLQVLMNRLNSLRGKFEREFMIKKLCEPIAQMNNFEKRTQAELDHRIRIKRYDDTEYIVPKIRWKKSLETGQDASVLSVWRDLKDRGILSDRTYTAGASVDLDVERHNLEEEKKWALENPAPVEEEGGMPGPAGGGGLMSAPKPPPTSGPAEAPEVGGASRHARQGSSDFDSFEDALEAVANGDGSVLIKDVLEAAESIYEGGQQNINKGLKPKAHVRDKNFRLPPDMGTSLLTGPD